MPRGVSSTLDYMHVALLYHIGTGALYQVPVWDVGVVCLFMLDVRDVVFNFLLPISVWTRSVTWIAFMSAVAVGLVRIRSPMQGP